MERQVPEPPEMGPFPFPHSTQVGQIPYAPEEGEISQPSKTRMVPLQDTPEAWLV